MRVLYVDDDRINTLLFTETCRAVGALQVECAGSGAEALELVRTFVPDMLVIDLYLPDTDGYQLLPALRAQLGRPALPALLCTAEDTALVAAPARAAGFDGCWTKPVDLATVRRELGARAMALPAAGNAKDAGNKDAKTTDADSTNGHAGGTPA